MADCPWTNSLITPKEGQSLQFDRAPVAKDIVAGGLAVDALREQAWIAGSHALSHVETTRGRSTTAITTAARAIALDARTGDLWVVAEQTLIVIAHDGETRLQMDLPATLRDASVMLHYDDARESLVLQTPARFARIARDGRILEESDLPTGWFVATPPPFRLDPAIALIRPPSGGATSDASSLLTLRFGAVCNRKPCELPDGYADGVRVVAQMNGAPMADAIIDPSSGRALFAPRFPMRPGVNRLTAQAVDRFGHRTEMTATLTVLADEPSMDAGAVHETSGAVAKEPATSTLKAPNKPPVVALTSPVSGTTYSAGATVTLAASASDPDGAIAKVEFYRGGSTLIGTASSEPYRFDWQNVAAGSYTLTAKAYDRKNGTATSTPVTIVVTNNQLPVVTLTSPAQGAFYAAGEPIPLAATASDPDGTVTRIEYFDGAVLIGSAGSAPFTMTWTDAPAGLHAIVARAIDDKGGVTNSPSIGIVIGQPPFVVVKSPAACSAVDGPLDLILAADAISKTGAIAQVEFFDGETLVGTSHEAPWHVTLTAASVGDHSITARATDERGLATTSRPSTVTVRTANRPPIVAVTSPGEGAHFATGFSVSLAAMASDPDGAVTAVEYRLGGSSGTLIGRGTSAPYSVPWTTTTPGAFALVAVAFDDLGATATSTAVHVTIDPNSAPSVTLTAPASNAVYTAPATIVLAASASDGDGSVAKVDFYAGTTLVGSSTAAPYTATWGSVAAGAYSLTAKATDNLGAIAVSAPVSLTVSNNAPPTVTLTVPAGGEPYFAPATISLSASAADSDGAIARVEFYANGALIDTASTAPYTFLWDGVAAGSYSVVARAIDNAGGTTASSPVAIGVSGGVDLSIAASLEGATIDDDNVLVQGFVSAPPNSAVTVNGVVTRIDDFGHFQANDVPLTPGANTVTAVVTTQDGQTTSRSATVNSTGRGPFVVHASPTDGLNSLQVTFTVENPDNLAFKQVNFDFDNDGLPNLIATPNQFVDGTLTVTATYPAGTWLAVIKVYDDDDNVLYSTSKSIVVLMPGVHQAKLRGIYDGMLARLKTGNISGALTALTGPAHEKYNAIFTLLQPTLASVVDQLGEIREINFGMDLAELSIVRNTPEGPKRFMLYLIRAEDGIWRIDGM